MSTPTTVTPRQLSAWRALLEAHAEIVARLAKELEAETGLSLNWYEVLLHLDAAEGRRLRMHELADSLLLSRSAATRFVDRMEEAGLVERVVCPSDRRGTFVVLSDHGLTTFRSAAPIHLRGVREHFARYVSDDEAVHLADIMGRLVGAARSRD